MTYRELLEQIGEEYGVVDIPMDGGSWYQLSMLTGTAPGLRKKLSLLGFRVRNIWLTGEEVPSPSGWEVVKSSFTDWYVKPPKGKGWEDEVEDLMLR